MSRATAAQVRQWSEEVAADPGAPAFLPLARTYRAQGRAEAAIRLCLRGLERNPELVEAHHLLGLLYREGGDLVRAFDEWDIALALDPEHPGARREIGLAAHARGEWALAVRHLERALEHDAFDGELRAALEDAWTRAGMGRAAESPAAPEPAPESAPGPVALVEAPLHAEGEAFATADDALRALAGERGIVGAVLMDDQGFVLAGAMEVEGRDRASEVAAVLSGAPAEASRALAHLGLGEWRGVLVETPEAVVRLTPAGEGMVVVAGRREVPTGWVLRVAVRARDAALRLLGGGR